MLGSTTGQSSGFVQRSTAVVHRVSSSRYIARLIAVFSGAGWCCYFVISAARLVLLLYTLVLYSAAAAAAAAAAAVNFLSVVEGTPKNEKRHVIIVLRCSAVAEEGVPHVFRRRPPRAV